MSGTGRRQPDRHGWIALDRYLHIHRRRLDEFRDGFVIADNLTYAFEGPSAFIIRGRIICGHGLFIDVVKVLELDLHTRRSLLARTMSYSYHAGFRGWQSRPVFRYDNAHMYPGHGDEHHFHRFDYATWRPVEPPDWIGRDRWPHLSDVIGELEDWWDSVGRHLDLDLPDDDEQTIWWQDAHPA